MFASVWQLVTTVFFISTLVKLIYKLVNDAKLASPRGATESQRRRRHAHQRPPPTTTTRPHLGAPPTNEEEEEERGNNEEATAAAAATPGITQPAQGERTGETQVTGSANHENQNQDQDDEDESEFLETLQFVLSRATGSSNEGVASGSGSRFLTAEQREEEQREQEARRVARQLYRRQLHPRPTEESGTNELPVEQEELSEAEAEVGSDREVGGGGDGGVVVRAEDCHVTSGFRIHFDDDDDQVISGGRQVINESNSANTNRRAAHLTGQIEKLFSGEKVKRGRFLRLIFLITESFLFEPLQTTLALSSISFAFFCGLLDCIGGVEASAEPEVRSTGNSSRWWSWSWCEKEETGSLPESSIESTGGNSSLSTGGGQINYGWRQNTWRSNYFHRRYFSRRSLSAALLSDDDQDDQDEQIGTSLENYVTTTSTTTNY